ncbi:MAG: hypothetical protein J7474_01325 [Arthrobacter sp.]|nr:hypothetical protein [Arthrobacter sp.]
MTFGQEVTTKRLAEELHRISVAPGRGPNGLREPPEQFSCDSPCNKWQSYRARDTSASS